MDKKTKRKVIFDKLLLLLSIFASIYMIYQILLLGPIEQVIRYIVITVIILIDILFIFLIFRKKRKKVLLSIISVVLIIIYVFVGFNIAKIYSMIDSMNKKYVTYSASLISLKENNYNINNLSGLKIGILNDKESIDGYVIPNDLITKYNLKKNNTIVEKEGYTALINALYNKELQLIFLPENYVDTFVTTEGFESIGEDTTVLISESKNQIKENQHLLGNSKSIKEPFTILLMGIDSTQDGLGNADSFNGDSLILLTFNPNNLNATMLSIPRDSYVPIACFKEKMENKITHAAQMGSKCVIDTIKDLTDIKIDYYIKINFTGLVDLVDAIGGVDVEVPYNLCEQDSQRRFGKNMIYIEKGFRHLNGEQALALSRNRKKNTEHCSSKWTSEYRDDYSRSKNQQEVVKAIVNKVKDVNNIDTLYKILDTIAKNIDTNMSTETILSFYNIAKDIFTRSKYQDELVTIEQLVLAGYGQTIYDERSGLNLWNHVPNKESLKDIIKEMKINLELEKHTMIKEFNYSIKNTYIKPIIGNGPYNKETSYDLLPDLTKYTKTKAEAWALKNNITLVFETIEDKGHDNGDIIRQNYPVLKRLDKIDNKTVKLTIVENTETTNPVTPPQSNKIDCLLDNNEKNAKCLIPNFSGFPKNYITTWGNQFSNTITLKYIEEESDKEEGTIIDQSIKAGTHIKDLINDGLTLKITLAKDKKTSSDKEDDIDTE